jgi:hypothetical protein
VNAEQASKSATWEPTRHTIGEGRRWGVHASWPCRQEARVTRLLSPTGVMAMACLQGKPRQTWEAPAVAARDCQRDAREGQARPCGVTERLVVAKKPGNAGRAKGPQFKDNAVSGKGPGNWR